MKKYLEMISGSVPGGIKQPEKMILSGEIQRSMLIDRVIVKAARQFDMMAITGFRIGVNEVLPRDTAIPLRLFESMLFGCTFEAPKGYFIEIRIRLAYPSILGIVPNIQAAVVGYVQ